MEQDNRNQINGENISNASAGGTQPEQNTQSIQSKLVRERSRIACIIIVI